MSGYQFLTSVIQVPKEWPVKTGPEIFIRVIERAMILHRSGQRVVVSIDAMPALITDDENYRGYILERIEEV